MLMLVIVLMLCMLMVMRLLLLLMMAMLMGLLLLLLSMERHTVMCIHAHTAVHSVVAHCVHSVLLRLRAVSSRPQTIILWFGGLRTSDITTRIVEMMCLGWI